MVGELNLQDYGVTADELKDLASKARESNKEEQVNAIRALVQALRDANDRISIEGMRYLYFLTQHVLDQELTAALREEVASLIKRYYGFTIELLRQLLLNRSLLNLIVRN